jgi:hypothetical protein
MDRHPIILGRLVAVILIVLSSQALVAKASAETVFYVAPTGKADSDGTEAAPFASIERAQQAVREKIALELSGNVRVLIRGGTYELSQPLTFGPQDSGSDKFSITYAAYPGEQVVVSGGRRITGWTKGKGGVWTTELPEVKEGKWYFRNLYVNGRRAIRARSPNVTNQTPWYGLKGCDEKTWAMTLGQGQVADWKNLPDVEIVLRGEWAIIRKRIHAADPATTTVIPEPPYFPASGFEPRAGSPFYLENARAFVDEPGEWYLDRTNGTLSYWPRPGEDLTKAVVIAPRLTALMEIRGTARQPVENLHFTGLCFTATDSVLPPQGYIGAAQGWCFLSEKTGGLLESAVTCQFTRACSIKNSQLVHFGGSAVRLGNGCSHFVLEGNQILDVGDIGVFLGFQRFAEGMWPNGPELSCSNQIVNNDISDCGAVFFDGVAVLVTFASDTLIAHNLIHDCSNHGISVATARETLPPGVADGYWIKNNDIHHVCQIMPDSGPIYFWGFMTNVVVSSNVVHDTGAYAAVYLDSKIGSRIEQNVVYDITRGRATLFNDNSDKVCVVRNNFWQGTNEFVRGKTGYALSFGTDRFLDFPDQASLESSQMTVEAWVDLRDVPRGNDPRAWVVCKNSNELTNGNYSLVVSQKNVGAYLNVGGGPENCYAAWSQSGPLSMNVWHHIAMSYDSTNLTIYCDGVTVGQTPVNAQRSRVTQKSDEGGTLNAQRSTDSGLLRIGKRVDGYNPSFPGLIRAVRIYNRALSLAEIAAQTTDYRPQTTDSGLPSPVSSPTSSGSSLKSPVSGLQTSPSGLVFEWNASDEYAKLISIMTAAGPEEPYRSRLLHRGKPLTSPTGSKH